TYRALPKQINEHHPDLVVSLHCNAFNKKATGTETLYYHASTEGKRMASLLQRKIVDVLGLADRGIKPKHSEDRGGYLLRETNAPCVLAEPFFIDNNKDLKIAQANHSDLVRAYADAINEMLV
ncbi:MAG: N-acetylmuramoyl-L-alanine amidase, partial [Deltaproteobacteria bacterium]|nr:N-acetylmuramoyl-L-alanine amidase [Deltaproteobacteria bacterium]